MSHSVDYEEDPQLAALVEQLRVALERGCSPDAALSKDVEAALHLLMARNLRRRVLVRMLAQGWLDGRPELARADLEALDAQLRERLPPLLARLEPGGSPQGA
jgi:hypothetical protein